MESVPSYLKKINILYVEDVAFNKDLLKQVLNRFHHEGDLLFGTSVNKSIELIRSYYAEKKNIDLIILDLNVPEKNSNSSRFTKSMTTEEIGTTIPFIREIRSYKGHTISNVPILVITNESDPNKKMLALEAGADKIIEKLTDPEKTIKIICDVFKKRYENPDQFFARKNKIA